MQIHACVSVCTHIFVFVLTQMHTHIYRHEYIEIQVRKCVYIHTFYICIHAHIFIYIYIYVYITYLHVYKYIYIYMSMNPCLHDHQHNLLVTACGLLYFYRLIRPGRSHKHEIYWSRKTIGVRMKSGTQVWSMSFRNLKVGILVANEIAPRP